MMSLGQRIRNLRMNKGLTQMEMGQGICTPSMISQIESDRANPSYKMLSLLAERLETPIEQLLVDVSINLEYASIYKIATAMVASKEYLSAIPLLLEVLERRRSTISDSEIQLHLAECYLHTHQFQAAEHLLGDVQANAMMREDSYLLAQTYQAFGMIELERKRFQLALFHWKKALDEVGNMEHVDIYLQASILTQLGSVHDRLGMIHEAVKYYAQASALYEGTDRLDEMARVYMWLGQAYKSIKDFEKAASYSDRAIAIFAGIANVYMSVKVQMSSAIAYGQIGREAEAIHLFEQTIQKFQELRKTEDVGITYVELAKVQISLGQFEEAKASCHIARSLLPELHIYQAWVNRLLGKIELQTGKRHEGYHRFQMAADCFKSLGEFREWAEVMADVSQMKYEENDLLGAFQIIHDVRLHTQQALYERGIVL